VLTPVTITGGNYILDHIGMATCTLDGTQCCTWEITTGGTTVSAHLAPSGVDNILGAHWLIAYSSGSNGWSWSKTIPALPTDCMAPVGALTSTYCLGQFDQALRAPDATLSPT
jgi:hypothetical protein